MLKALLKETGGVSARFEVTGDLACWAGAIDLAARLGLEATGLTLPLTGTRVRVGPELCDLGDLPDGAGLIIWSGDTLLITGTDGDAVCRAARYLAWFGEALVDTDTFVVTRDLVVALPDTAADAPRLTSLEGLFAPEAAVQFALTDGLTEAELGALLELAARLGVEATKVRFPVALLPGETRHGGPVLTLTGDGADIALTPDGLTVRGAEAIRYLATQPDVAPPAWVHAHPGAPAPAPQVRRWEYEGAWEVDRFWRIWRDEVAPTLPQGEPVTVDLRLSEPLSIRQQVRAELLATLPVGSDVHVRSCFKQGLHWISEEVIPELRGLPVARIELGARRFTGAAPEGETVLDLPIRWLQECYPADAILARELAITPADVALALTDDGPTYQLTAFDPGGVVLAQFTLEAQAGARRYLDAFPERGWVHPPTGSLMVNGRTFGLIPTDAEELWDWYQSTVLAELRSHIVAEHGERPGIGAQPLFGTLRFDVWLSEENERLDVREEHISPLDGLHEDLYFVTLDEMATWGRQLHDQPFGAPGQILPYIHEGKGAPPRAIVTLTERQTAAPVPAGTPVVSIDVDGPTFHFADGRSARHAVLRLAATPVQGISLTDVIGPEQLPGCLTYLAGLSGVRVWQVGISFQGRPLYAVAAGSDIGEEIRPLRKASALKPTLLINARHHANEVSSTNAVLKLVELAAIGGGEAAELLQRVNLVVLPLENIDGAASHYDLMQEHPTWKHHAARFNAAGLEFYGQYIDPETPYTEARALPALFDAARPDVLLDDHGVPSHEWLQPFAGYSSAPYFRISYWLPNALLYGIFRDLDQEKYPHQVAATGALRSVLTRRVRESELVFGENQAWLETYRRWGAQWDGKKFPLELHDGMICYTWPAGPHAFSVRFPETCVIDWVTEVPDETAVGAHLAATAEAHLVGHMACLEFLAAHPQPVERSVQRSGRAVVRSVGRRRPFSIN